MQPSTASLSRFVFPRLHPIRFFRDPVYRESVCALVSEGVGGFVLFDGSPEQVARTVSDVRGMAGERRLLVAADCEFGLRMRFDGGTEFPDMWCFGSANEPDLTKRAATAIAREMRAIGLDWNFAPVLDVNTNPDNPVINLRSFGEDPSVVAWHGRAYVRGLQEGGVIACGKHFPGHGDTDVDSHIGLPVLGFRRDRLEETELVPFRAALGAGLLSVMTAHIAVPAIDESGDPASLSQPVVEGLLRTGLGFDGVAVTDALDMKGVVGRYGTAEVARRAFLAGNDVLEVPDDPMEALRGLRDGFEQGAISEERIERSALRLDRLIAFRERFADASAEIGAGEEEPAAIAARVARLGIVVREHAPDLVHLSAPAFGVVVRDERGAGSAGHWSRMVLDRFGADVLEVVVGNEVDASELERVRTMAGRGTLLLATMIRPRGGAGRIDLTENGAAAVGALEPSRTIHVNFGNPYLLRDFPSVLRLDAFSASVPSLEAGLERLEELLSPA